MKRPVRWDNQKYHSAGLANALDVGDGFAPIENVFESASGNNDIEALITKTVYQSFSGTYNIPENSGKLFLAVFRPHIHGLYETHPYIRGCKWLF